MANILIPHLKKYYLRLTLKTHGKHGAGGISKKTMDLIGSDLVSINYGIASVIFYGNVDIMKDLQARVQKLEHMYLKEKERTAEEWDFPAIGEGNIDFRRIFKMLEKGNNPCPLIVKIEFTKADPKDLAEMNKAVKTSYNYLTAHGFVP